MQPNTIEGEGIFHITKVKCAFIKTVRNVENLTASDYKTHRLRKRMKKQYPQLVFQASRQKNKGFLVYQDTISRSDVMEVLCMC